MSLREKAREVREAGIEERGNFTPHGTPLNLYNYWLSRTDSRRGILIRAGLRKENFCHFWRVVLFWAPFMAFRRKANSVLTHPATVVLVVLAALGVLVYACATSGSVLGVVAFILLVALAIASLAVGSVAGVSAGTERLDREYSDILIDHPRNIAIFFVLGLPSAVVAFLVTKFVHFYADHLVDHTPAIAITVCGLLVTAFLTAVFLTDGWIGLAVVLGMVVGILGGFLLLIVSVNALADYISGRRKLARERALRRYDEEDRTEEDLPTEPGRLEKVFRGFADFIVLLAQVVRVKKWKICPIVDVDGKTS